MLLCCPSTCFELRFIWFLFCGTRFFVNRLSNQINTNCLRIQIDTCVVTVRVLRSMKFIRIIFNYLSLELIIKNIMVESELVTHFIIWIFNITLNLLILQLWIKVTKKIILSLLVGWHILLIHFPDVIYY